MTDNKEIRKSFEEHYKQMVSATELGFKRTLRGVYRNSSLQYLWEGYCAAHSDMEKTHVPLSEVNKLVEALEEQNEFTCSILDNMQHYFDNKCCPTMDEINQCVISDSNLRMVIGNFKTKYGEKKEG